MKAAWYIKIKGKVYFEGGKWIIKKKQTHFPF
jgi:hypothetical protein